MMCDPVVSNEMLDAGLDELEGCLTHPYSWDDVRDRIRAAYLAMDRERVMRELLEGLIADAASTPSPS